MRKWIVIGKNSALVHTDTAHAILNNCMIHKLMLSSMNCNFNGYELWACLCQYLTFDLRNSQLTLYIITIACSPFVPITKPNNNQYAKDI